MYQSTYRKSLIFVGVYYLNMGFTCLLFSYFSTHLVNELRTLCKTFRILCLCVRHILVVIEIDACLTLFSCICACLSVYHRQTSVSSHHRLGESVYATLLFLPNNY